MAIPKNRASMTPQRRRFLKALTAGGLAYAIGRTAGTTFGQMSGVSGFPDYKALVCVFLYGGNDSWNMLVPTSTAEYNAYARSRGAGTSSTLAIDKDKLLSITTRGFTPGDPTYGLYPGMPEIRDLFNAGRVAILPNVGPLLRPTTKDQYKGLIGQNHDLPPQLFSHNDQQDQWNSLRGKFLLNTGWGGRMADVLAARLGAQQIPINVSLFGQTLFQAATTVDPYVMGVNGVNTFPGLTVSNDQGPDGWPYNAGRRQGVDAVLASTIASRDNTYYHRGFARVQERALRYADRISQALTSAYRFNALPDGERLSLLSIQLRTVAKMISQRARLSMSRQVFLVAIGGFDTHDNQLDDQPKLLADVSKSIKAFHDAMNEIGLGEQVTLFTQSDFGRTLTSNGDGSDHGWGGVQMVVGGAVRGGQMYGQYPVLEIDGPLEVGGGILIPTVSSDQYAATLASWFGVADSDLPAVAPNVVNFSSRNLGFMV
jgi:uncharacterized protein (DUF1501 family)